MASHTSSVTLASILIALALGVLVQAQQKWITAEVAAALRARAAEGDAGATAALRGAADEGDAAAQVELGFMYFYAGSVPQDYAEAVRLYRLAAEQGYAFGQYTLGRAYASGEGVPQDDVSAYTWFNLAVSRSSGDLRDNSIERREDVAKRLTPVQLSDAQRLTREWDAAHPREP